MDKIRIVLADDHAVVREGLKALIAAQDDMEVVGEATNGLEVCHLAARLMPHIILMDISMPELGGAAATDQIRREQPNIKIIALTFHESEGYLQQFLQAGASGYVLKRSAAEDLVKAIRDVASGGVYLDPKAADQVVHALRKSTETNRKPDSSLTDREADVVKLLALGYINREIAEQLDLSVKTVEIHKARALEKLGLRSRADVVQFALRRGWLIEN